VVEREVAGLEVRIITLPLYGQALIRPEYPKVLDLLPSYPSKGARRQPHGCSYAD
jgi:hypothetical protein